LPRHLQYTGSRHDGLEQIAGLDVLDGQIVRQAPGADDLDAIRKDQPRTGALTK